MRTRPVLHEKKVKPFLGGNTGSTGEGKLNLVGSDRRAQPQNEASTSFQYLYNLCFLAKLRKGG